MLPVCNSCWFQDHDACSGSAVEPSDGGLTHCQCHCWDDDTEE